MDNARECEGKAQEIPECVGNILSLGFYLIVCKPLLKKKNGNHTDVFSGQQQFLLAKLCFAIPSWEYLSGDIAVLIFYLCL